MKKRPKILIVMMLIVALVGCSPAWAEEGDVGDAVGDIVSGSNVGNDVPSAEAGADAGGTDNGDSGSGEPGDAGEPGEPGDAGNAVGGNDGGIPTVNVSAESVEAIAFAVNRSAYQYDYQYIISTDTGFSVILDTNIPNLVDSYNVVVDYTGYAYKVYIGTDLFVWLNGADTMLKHGDSGVLHYHGQSLFESDTVISFETLSDLSNSVWNMAVKNVVYASQHIYWQDGSLYYSSAYVPAPTFECTFHTGVDGLSFPSQSVTDVGAVVLPDVEGLEGYTFEGWYIDSEYKTLFDDTYSVTSDFTLYGKFVPIPKVSFVFPFEELEVDPQYSNALQLPNIDKDGYTFVGWYYDEAFLQPFNSTAEITEDITLYAYYAESSAMSVFSTGVFDSLTALFAVDAIRYILAIMALVIIFGAIKILTSFRG